MNSMNKKFWIALLILGTGSALTGCGGKSVLRESTTFYPPPPQPPKVQFLVRYQSSDDLGVKQGGFKSFVTGESEKINSLNKPHDVAIYDGKLYICDSRRAEVVIMDIKNKKMSVLGEDEKINITKPVGIAIAPDGMKYVADIVGKRIVVFDKDDIFVKSFGSADEFGPTSVGVFGDKLYVADNKDHEVEVRDRFTGDTLRTFQGSEDSEFGLFHMPVNLTLDGLGNLYVSDLMSNTIFVFDSELNFLRNIGRPGDTYGTFGRVRGVAVDSGGNVFASDAAFENVQVFGADGDLKLFFGGPGNKPGNMFLPAGMAISYNDLEVFKDYVDDRFELEFVLLVANQYGPQGISVYGFGDGKPGHFAERGELPEPSTTEDEAASAEESNDSDGD